MIRSIGLSEQENCPERIKVKSEVYNFRQDVFNEVYSKHST